MLAKKPFTSNVVSLLGFLPTSNNAWLRLPICGPFGMTPDEMRIAEEHYRDASVWLFNLSVAIRYPSSEQAEMMNGGSMS